MNDNGDLYDMYTITVNRESLNKLMSYFSQTGEVKIGVEKTGEISFQIPEESEISIVHINVIKELTDKIEELQHKMEATETKKDYEKMQVEQRCFIVTLSYLIKLFSEKLKTKPV